MLLPGLSEFQSSPVILWGGGIILLLLAIYPLMFVSGAVSEKQEQVGLLQEKLQKMNSVRVSDEIDWRNGISRVAEIRKNLAAKYWKASSADISEVEIRNWVTDLAQTVGMSELNVQLDSSGLRDVEGVNPSWQINVSIAAYGESVESVLALIRAIEEARSYSEIVQVSLSENSFEMIVKVVVLREEIQQ
jgi:hypothetical protein